MQDKTVLITGGNAGVGKETAVGLLRMGADVVNISFGGPSLYSDGREVSAKFVDDAVAKYGYAVVLSAGNSGPALGTIGSPAVARRAIATCNPVRAASPKAS